MRVDIIDVLLFATRRHRGVCAQPSHRVRPCSPLLQVLDEPLYAHYLTLTGVYRPYTEQVLASQHADGNSVMRDIHSSPTAKVCDHSP